MDPTPQEAEDSFVDEAQEQGPPAPEADPLRIFLLGQKPLQPYVKPWIKLFLEASRLPQGKGWRSSGMTCWTCSEEDLVFHYVFWPCQVPFDCVLCLKCGSLSITSFPGLPAPQTRLLGGEDWAEPDPAVDLLRHGIRVLADQTPLGPGDKSWEFD